MKQLLGAMLVLTVFLGVGYMYKEQVFLFSSKDPDTVTEKTTYETATEDSSSSTDDVAETTIQELQEYIHDYEETVAELEKRLESLLEEKTRLETENTALREELDESKHKRDEYRDTIETMETEISSLEDQIGTLNKEIHGIEEEVDYLNLKNTELENQVTSLQSTIDTRDSRIRDLESDRDEVLGIVVTQHYEYVYGGWLWKDRYQWDLDIPLSLYWTYLDKPRPSHTSQWVDMANDPADDRYIDAMVRQINSAAIEEGFTESEKVEFVVAFVQSLPYTEDRVSTPWNEYPRYPIETLFDRGGDCEDTSILVAALLDCMGYDTALLLLYKERHAAVGVSISGASGSYYTVDGQRYYYLETTGEGFDIGQIPDDFTETSAYVYPLNP